LFIGVLFTLNKLNSDSELVVMSASGLSPLQLFRPFALLFVLATALVAATSLWAMPASFREITAQFTKIRADMVTRVILEGQFAELDAGFVFHYRERQSNGDMRGLFIQDRRDAQHVSTYVAEVGRTIEIGAQNYLVLERGSIQRQSPDAFDPAIIQFERYAIDLAQFGGSDETGPLRARERSTFALLNRDPDEPMVRQLAGRFRQELHERFLNPIYGLVFGMIAFAALCQPKTTRQGRGLALAGAIVAALSMRIAGFGTSGLILRSESGVVIAYAMPALVFALASLQALKPDVLSSLFSRPKKRERAA
ncbi:MAG: export transporter permease LptF, partial [Pseudomonadota bacterium]